MVFASRSAVRERVPWPKPRLAMFDTCRRMSSIEVVRLVSGGLGRPSTSHRIFGFRVARARFFHVLFCFVLPYFTLISSIVSYFNSVIDIL